MVGVRQIIGTALLALLVCTQGLQAQKSQSSTAVPFQLQRGHALTLRGTIGRLNNRCFLVDTGVYWTVIDQRIADQLRLTASGSSILVSANEAMKLPNVVIPEMRLGPLVIHSLPAVVMDLKDFRSRTGLDVDGFIGIHVLSQSAAKLDFTEDTIRFGPISPTKSGLETKAFMEKK